MYIENKLLNIVLGVISFLMIIAIIFMNYVINNNRKAISFFDLNDFSNISYRSDNNKFKIDNGKITLVIDDETIYDKKDIKFDETTGEIVVDGDKNTLYVRSVGRTNITLWYKYQNYVFEKEIIAN